MLITCRNLYGYLEVSTKPSSTINALYIATSAIYHVSATTFFFEDQPTNRPTDRPTKRIKEAPVGKAKPELKKGEKRLQLVL